MLLILRIGLFIIASISAFIIYIELLKDAGNQRKSIDSSIRQNNIRNNNVINVVERKSRRA